MRRKVYKLVAPRRLSSWYSEAKIKLCLRYIDRREMRTLIPAQLFVALILCIIGKTALFFLENKCMLSFKSRHFELLKSVSECGSKYLFPNVVL